MQRNRDRAVLPPEPFRFDRDYVVILSVFPNYAPERITCNLRTGEVR